MMQKVGAIQFFPVQVGGPTEYARSRMYLFLGVAIYQLLMGIMAVIEFMNILSGIIMILGAFMAWFAWKENMNITYICWWGMFSLVGFICGIATFFIGFAVKISTIVIKANVPLSCAFGLAVWWWLYSNYVETHDTRDILTSWLRGPPFRLIKPVQELPYGGMPFDTQKILPAGNLPQFGGGMPATPSAWNKHWNQFTSEEMSAATTLGWTEETWEKSIPPPSNSKDWAQLSRQEQDAATKFGWNVNTWNIKEQMEKASSWAGNSWQQAQGAGSGMMGTYGAMATRAAPAPPGRKDVQTDPFMTR